MHKALKLKHTGSGVEPGLGTLVLLEGVQLADVEHATRLQDQRRLPEHSAQILNVLQRQAARHQVGRARCKVPRPGNISLLKPDIGAGYFRLRFRSR